jgi:hypothetical protein
MASRRRVGRRAPRPPSLRGPSPTALRPAWPSTGATLWPTHDDAAPRASAGGRRRVPPQGVRRSLRIPDRDELPPGRADGDGKVLRAAAAPPGDEQGLPGLPPVRPKIGGPEALPRGHLPPTGPARLGRLAPAGGIDPDRRNHGADSTPASPIRRTRPGAGREDHAKMTGTLGHAGWARCQVALRQGSAQQGRGPHHQKDWRVSCVSSA